MQEPRKGKRLKANLSKIIQHSKTGQLTFTFPRTLAREYCIKKGDVIKFERLFSNCIKISKL